MEYRKTSEDIPLAEAVEDTRESIKDINETMDERSTYAQSEVMVPQAPDLQSKTKLCHIFAFSWTTIFGGMLAGYCATYTNNASKVLNAQYNLTTKSEIAIY